MAPKKSKQPSGTSSSSGSRASSKLLDKTYQRKEPRRFELQEVDNMTDNFSKLIGRGSYAMVFRGQLDDEDIAVKQYEKSHKTYWENEINALVELEYHQYIITLLGICSDDEQYCLIMNYVPNNLEIILQARQLEWTQTHKILLQLALAIKAVSEKKFVVGDIKPDSVLLDEEYNVLLCDFGSAKKDGIDLPTVNPHYAAKEIFQEKGDCVSEEEILEGKDEELQKETS